MTANPHLIPTSIVDKNGRATTVHRKAARAIQGVSSIPAPVKQPAAKPYSPTDLQLEQKEFRVWFTKGIAEPKLSKLTNLMTGMPCVFEANDVEYYSVQSVVDTEDTLLLMQYGVRSGEEAKEVLAREGILHRLVDHSSLSDKALRQKVPAPSFCYFVSGRTFDGVDEDNLIEAVKIKTHKGFQAARSHRPLDSLVLEGKVKASDLRVIGPQHLKSKYGTQDVVMALERINAGNARYNAQELRTLLDWIKSDDTSDSLTYESGIGIADRIGIEATMSLRMKNKAWRVLKSLNGRVAPSEEEAFITYADRSLSWMIGRGIAGNLTEGAIALYRSGVDPEMARRQLEEGKDVEAIIGAHLNVHNTIVGGWL